MATEAQILANRRNALRSSGPRSQAGRARSAMNACKSGIYAQSEIIPGEDPAELEGLKSRYYASLQPEGHETDLVDEAIRAGWRLRRIARAEADIWTMSMNGDMEKNRKKGLPENKHLYISAIQDNPQNFDRVYRYQASVARILHRSLETLLRLRKDAEFLLPAETEVGQTLPPANPEPHQSDETNPIPSPVAPAVPAASDKSAETNPIPDPQNRETASDPRPPIPDPAPYAPRPGFRYYNGHRIPITEIPKS